MAMDSTVGVAFQSALESFKDSLTEHEKAYFQGMTRDTLQGDIDELQEKQGTDRKLQNLTRLSSFLEAMRQYEDIVELFLNTSEFVAFVWTASAYSDAFNSLLEAYQQIGETLPLLKQYESLLVSNPHMRIALQFIYKDILEFHRKALNYFKGSTWKKLFKSLWKTFNTDFSRILSNLNGHRRLIENQADIVQIEEFQRIREAAEQQWKIQHECELLRRQVAVQSWLSAANPEEYLDDGIQARSDDSMSGLWLLSAEPFKTWAESNGAVMPMLWITGIPGSGKTVLASVVIEEFRKSATSSTIFFFCKYCKPDYNSFISIVKSLLLQLMIRRDIRNDKLIAYVYEQQATSGQATLTSVKLAKSLIETALSSEDNVKIILDGLDECRKDEAKVLLTWIQPLIESEANQSRNVRCLFISQEDNLVPRYLKSVPKMKIKPEDNKQDILRFVKIGSKKIQQKFKLDDCFTGRITKLIEDRTKGMFIFAKLATENLLEQVSRTKLELELHPNTFPQELSQVYNRIVHRILENSASKEDVERLLAWLVCAKRQLFWREIQAGISVDVENRQVDFPGRELCIDPKGLFGSIVEFRMNGLVELVHRTAELYLVKEEVVMKSRAEHDMAVLCLSYLSLPCMDPDLPEGEISTYLQKGWYAFLDYAAANWHRHVEEALASIEDQTLLDEISETLGVFLESCVLADWQDPPKPRKASKTLQILQREDFYSQFIDAIDATKKQLQSLGKGASTNEVLNLPQIISIARSALETVDTENAATEDYYGPKFKCPRMNCKSFHNGYENELARNDHLAMHDRPFLCTFEDCPQLAVGFATLRSLQAHLLKDHNIDESSDDHFPSLNPLKHQLDSIEETFDSKKGRTSAPSRFKCSIENCSKAFTRKQNLLAHLSSHKKDKPYMCDVCSKQYARVSDRNRHRQTHAPESKRVCGGQFQTEDGQTVNWGCGKQFTRADGIRAHFRTESGGACYRALMEYKASAERRRGKNSVSQEASQLAFSQHNGIQIDGDQISRQIPVDQQWHSSWEDNTTMVFETGRNSTQSSSSEFSSLNPIFSEPDPFGIDVVRLPSIDELLKELDSLPDTGTIDIDRE